MAGTTIIKAPKTEAGIRTVAIPPNILPSLKAHLRRFVSSDVDGLILRGEKGRALRPRMLQDAWTAARESAGRTDLHFHDLRHSGLTWAAATSATLAELMHRAGRKSPAAALRYQHATRDGDRALAAALSALARPAGLVELKVKG